MKKIIITLALLSALTAGAFGQQYDPENDFTVEVIDNGRAVQITEYVGNKTIVNIPPRIRNLPVTGIRGHGFREKNLISVTIPNSVTSIGNYTFRDNQLTNVIIPNSITSIGTGAFYNNQLTNVIIPNSVTSIGIYAFDSNQLTSVTIPNSVTSIGIYAFDSNQLTSVTVPNSVTSIRSDTFGNNPLTRIIIPADVTIVSDAFGDIVDINGVLIGDLYNSKGKKAFHYENGFAANLVLPANNPKLADQKLGAAVFQEIQILRFLGNTEAVNRHEAVLQFITGRGNATRAEIETFYRNNVRALIASVVDEELINGKSVNNDTRRVINDIITAPLTNFYLSPNQTNFDLLRRIVQVFSENALQIIMMRNTRMSVEVFRELGNLEAAQIAQQTVDNGGRNISRIFSQVLGVNISGNVEWEKVGLYEPVSLLNQELARRLR